MAGRKSKVFALALGQGLMKVSNLVCIMIFTRIFSKAEYATFRQTFLAYEFATPLLTLGIPSAMYYFLAGAKERRKGMILDNILLLAIMGCIFSLFLLFGGTSLIAKRFNNPELNTALRWLIAYPLYTFPAMSLGAVLIINERVKLATIFNVISNLALSALMIAGCWITYDYRVPLYIKVFFPAITLPILIYLAFSTTEGEWDRPRFASMANLLKFSVPLGFATMLGSISIQLDRMVVSFMCSPEEFAVYSNGAMEIPVIGMITGAISTVIIADIRKYCIAGNKRAAVDLFRKAATQSAMFLFPIMLFFFIYADNIIRILYTQKYIGSTLPFRIYLFTIPIRVVHYGSAYMALGMTKEAFWRTVGNLICNAILSVILVFYFGSIGAAIAGVITLYVWSIPANLFNLAKGFECSMKYVIPFFQLGKIMLVSFLTAIISFPVRLLHLHVMIEFVCGGLVFGFVYILFAKKYIEDFSYLLESVLSKFKKRVSFLN